MTKEIEQNIQEVKKVFETVSGYEAAEIADFMQVIRDEMDKLYDIKYFKTSVELGEDTSARIHAEMLYDSDPRDDHPSPREVYGPAELGMK